MGIEAWSTTAADNDATPPNGAPEGMAFNKVNDVIRQNMASVRAFYEDPLWTDFGHVPTYVSGTSFTIPTDLTASYAVGRRVKLTGTTPFTVYGTIATSAYSAPNTTITITADSGTLNATLNKVYLSAVAVTNSPIPSLNPFPVADSTSILKGSSDATKLVRFEVDGLTTATTRVITVPDADITLAGLASPAFTGTPTAPTASGGTNTTQIATTEFVQTAVGTSTKASYTPVLTFGGGSTGIAYSIQSGYSIKDKDNLVTCWVTIQLSNKGSSTGTAVVSLPYTSTMTQAVNVMVIADNMSSFTGYVGRGLLSATGSTVTLRREINGTGTAINDTHFTNTSFISFVIQYVA
jgi:hypothetical protein